MSNLPVSLSDLVRERIQKDFVSLIPDENWKQLVEGCIKEFTTKQLRDRNTARERSTSNLEELIYKELEDQAKAFIKAELAKPELGNSLWGYADNGMAVPLATQIVQEICDKHAHKIFSAVVGSMVQNVMMNMRNSD